MVKFKYRYIFVVLINCLAFSTCLNLSLRQLFPIAFDAVVALVSRQPTDENARLPKGFLYTGDLIKKNGYQYDSYKVTTEDGYILNLHRILPASRYGRNSEYPVFIQHGLMASSDTWLLLGNRSLPYLLANQGYDVWIGDQRGNTYSRQHVKYKPQDHRFWNFTFHECGLYDTPAFIDFILEITGKPQLFYIGHSMGTTVFLTMASLKPEYNDKVKTAVFLAPVANCPLPSELTSPLLRVLLLQADTLKDRLIRGRLHEVFPRSASTISALKNLCSPNSNTLDFCLDAVGMVYGENRNNLDKNTLAEKMNYVPAGASTLVFHHLSQLYAGDFRMYDYGEKRNMLTYGSPLPPSYPLEKVTTPVAVIYGDNDLLVNEKSSLDLVNRLPNVIMSKKIEDPKFTHGDFIIGENAKTVLYDHIINLLNSV